VKLILSRLIAILLLIVPGIGAAYGFLLMKDALYNYFADMGNVSLQTPHFAWGSFLIGFILFLLGISFIGGWIFFRDRKHNYLSTRFRPKRPRPPRHSETEGGGTGSRRE
jgi:Na+/alanine symporter